MSKDSTINNVVSYETALRLKEAGIEIETQFCYLGTRLSLNGENIDTILSNDKHRYYEVNYGEPIYRREIEFTPAPTFAELWAVLPCMITINNEIWYKVLYD
jgi:hypothetical protein